MLSAWQQIRLLNGRCIKEKFSADSSFAALLAFVRHQRQSFVENFTLIQVAFALLYLFSACTL